MEFSELSKDEYVTFLQSSLADWLPTTTLNPINLSCILSSEKQER
jgi:hypothetical protein